MADAKIAKLILFKKVVLVPVRSYPRHKTATNITDGRSSKGSHSHTFIVIASSYLAVINRTLAKQSKTKFSVKDNSI